MNTKQVVALRAFYQGKDCFVWLPGVYCTGYGKSLCYQLLPLLFHHNHGRIGAPEAELSVVLVVSPLMSLMIDQVSNLIIGISAAILSGNLGVDKDILPTKETS